VNIALLGPSSNIALQAVNLAVDIIERMMIMMGA